MPGRDGAEGDAPRRAPPARRTGRRRRDGAKPGKRHPLDLGRRPGFTPSRVPASGQYVVAAGGIRHGDEELRCLPVHRRRPGGVALIGDEGIIRQILRIRVAQDDVGQAAVADEGGRRLVEAPDLVRDLDIRLGPVDKLDSHWRQVVVQQCLLAGGGVGTLSDERRGMGGLSPVPDWEPGTGWPPCA